ncbi:transglutaminase-like domain-containing protein [Candidatus Woesearchaeota archaeon]|nr:transglutaminase-like domain-containing protein [Candidatus Woesearchaeota archaeon]
MDNKYKRGNDSKGDAGKADPDAETGDAHGIEKEEKWYKGPIRYLILLFLLLIIILWYFPKESIKLDPDPVRIPMVQEVLPADLFLENRTTMTGYKWDLSSYIRPNDPLVKQTANKIATIGCDGSRICQSKAIYYFVRDNIEYVSDPLEEEYIEENIEVLNTRAADCEGGTLLMASLMGAIGIRNELVFVPGHVFLRVRMDEALKRYKIGDWIYLDWTCKACSFGELPLADKRYLDEGYFAGN